MLNFIRQGAGPPLLLAHGLGRSWRSWTTILPALFEAREVVAPDLPRHGDTPAAPGSDIVGSSLGARIVLEMARRGRVGATIALDSGGFWRGWERTWFRTTLIASIRLVRGLGSARPALCRSAATRSLLLAQLSARPWKLDGGIVTTELEGFATTKTFAALVRDPAAAPERPAAEASRPVVIGWGRQGRLCLPRQALRAKAAFPSARVHWFEKCGHFPMWDQPQETVRTIFGESGQAE